MILHLSILLGLAAAPVQDTAEPRLWNSDQVTFLTRPQPQFPERASSSRGEVTVVCVLTAGGTFRGCQVETETPSGSGFGRAAVAAMQRGARIDMAAGGPVEGDRMRGIIRFWNGR